MTFESVTQKILRNFRKRPPMSTGMSKSTAQALDSLLIRDGSIWDLPSSKSTPVRQVTPTVTPSTELAIIEILRGGVGPGETHLNAGNRKEVALQTIFASLPVLECLAVQRRFEIDATNDELPRAFHRLVPERRVRLVRYLQDLRRGRCV